MTALPSRGKARYAGQSCAVEPVGDVFSGPIDLQAWLGIERINADMTNTTNAKDNGACQHNGRAVTIISLPRTSHAELGTDTDGGTDSTVSGFPTRIAVQGSVFERYVTGSTFTGYFVGDSENEVFGTWTVGILLSGEFDANRQSTSSVTLPPVPDGNGPTVEHNDIPSGLSN